MWSIEFTQEAKKDILNIPKKAQELIKRAISDRLETDPISYGKPLRFSLKGERSLRVSKYRVLYKIVGNVVIISRIAIRRDVYKH